MVNRDRPYYKRNITTRDGGSLVEFWNNIEAKNEENVRRNEVMDNVKYHRKIIKLIFKIVPKGIGKIPDLGQHKQ